MEGEGCNASRLAGWTFPGVVSEGSFLRTNTVSHPPKEWPAGPRPWKHLDGIPGTDYAAISCCAPTQAAAPRGLAASSLRLRKTTNKQQAAESHSPASPRGTSDQAKCHSRIHKGTPLAFKLTMLSSSDPVPFDPTLCSNRSEQTCLTSLMRINLPGQ